MAKTCIRCGYERRATDSAPGYACPGCGVVYAKAEAAQAGIEAHRARIAAMAAIAVARAAVPAAAGEPAAPHARAEALMRQMSAQRAAAQREPSRLRGMGLVALVAFSIGFACAAGMYSAAAKMRKPVVEANEQVASACLK